jgi:pimeloyl-ACP methyl ester carboxylesterase
MIPGKENQQLELENGSMLGYAEWGDPSGRPVFHFHGSSSSRLEHPPDPDMLSGIRLITIDRPGHGLSDFRYGWRLLDWTDYVVALADHLSIDAFAVMGWSFGGPYALACAFKIPERLIGVGLISSFAPYDRPGATDGMPGFSKLALGMARRAPWWLARRFMGIQGRALLKDPEGVARQILSSVPEADREVLEDPAVKATLLPAMSEAYRSGADGAAWEGAMLVRPWGFRLEDIRIPVHVWHGDADVNNPLQCAEYSIATIPNTKAVILPNQGHFFIMRRWGEILAELVASAS